MPYEVFNGLVLRECDCGENDKLITVLTAEHGKITILAKGAKSVRSKNAPAIEVLCYSELAVKEHNGFYTLSEASINEHFFSLRKSLKRTVVGQYIAQVTDEVCVENVDESAMLSLALNCLYMLSKPEADCDLVKAVFELRCMAEIGYMPDVSGCSVCGKNDHKCMYLDVMEGNLVCGDCFGTAADEAVSEDISTARIIIPLSAEVTAAMRYVVSSRPKRIFSFDIPKESIPELSRVCEKYLVNHLERSFNTLDFYNSVKDKEDILF